MIAFIDDHRGEHGVEPIREQLSIAPSTCHDHPAKRAGPARLSDRAGRDVGLRSEIPRVFEADFRVHGVRKVWRRMRREGFDVARRTVARLMKDMGIEGVTRGKKIRTTIADKAAPCPLDRVNRQFRAPAPDTLCPYGDASIAYRVTGERLHPRRDPDRLRLRRVRDQRLRPPRRGLARQSDGPCRIRPRCPGAGRPPAPSGKGRGSRSSFRQGGPNILP